MSSGPPVNTSPGFLQGLIMEGYKRSWICRRTVPFLQPREWISAGLK